MEWFEQWEKVWRGMYRSYDKQWTIENEPTVDDDGNEMRRRCWVCYRWNNGERTGDVETARTFREAKELVSARYLAQRSDAERRYSEREQAR